jgi:transcription antitermination factor NusG
MNWYIAITNPNCHRRAEAGLAAIGYPSFWPKLRKWVSHARTKVAKEYPILGRYLFVEIPDREFFAVRNVNGVEGLLVGDSGAPAKIPPEIVWRFRERYMRGEWDFVTNETGEFFDYEKGEIVVRTNPIPTGAIVRIMEGEFADMLAVIRSRRNGKLEFLPQGAREFSFTREQNVRAA